MDSCEHYTWIDVKHGLVSVIHWSGECYTQTGECYTWFGECYT